MRARAWLASVGLAASACAAHGSASGTCEGGLLLVDGACLGPREVDAYCGTRSIAVGNAAACAVPTCAKGEALDPIGFTCVAGRTVRALVARDRALADDAIVACRDDLVLVAHGERVACLSHADACPLLTRWDGKRGCVPEAPCPAGEIRPAASGTSCVRVRRGRVIDVGLWARAVLPDRLCRNVARAAAAFGDAAATGHLSATILLGFPDNDVTGATGTPRFDPPAPPEAAQAQVQATIDALLIPLRALGGTADAASASLRVTCALPLQTAPRVVPAEPASD